MEQRLDNSIIYEFSVVVKLKVLIKLKEQIIISTFGIDFYERYQN